MTQINGGYFFLVKKSGTKMRNYIRKADKRGSITIPKDLVAALGLQQVNVYYGGDTLSISNMRVGGPGPRTRYKVDSNGNVRVTKKMLGLIGIADYYKVSEGVGEILIKVAGKNQGASPIIQPVATELVDIIVLVDRSGSMQSIRKPMQDGLNKYIQEQQAVPGNVRLSLYSFDSYGIEAHCIDRPIKDAPKFTLNPRASTPLYQSIVQTIKDTLERHKGVKPDKVIYVCITDGEENASRYYSRSDVIDLINKVRTQHLWQVIFMGTTFNAEVYGQGLGVGKKATMTFQNTQEGIKNAFESLTSGTIGTRSMDHNTYVDTVTNGLFFDDEDYSKQRK